MNVLGSLPLPAGSDCRRTYCVDLKNPLAKGVLMVDASTTDLLPAGVLLQPMFVLNSAFICPLRSKECCRVSLEPWKVSTN